MNGFNKYLKRTKQSYACFGRKINKPRETVRRWAMGESIPQSDNRNLILEATNRKITLKDFIPL